MNKLTPLLLFLLLLSFSSCKNGTGTLLTTLEAKKNLSAEDTVKFKDIYRQRLRELGIGDNNIGISFRENRITITISELSRYDNPEFRPRLRKLLRSDAHISFWETYNVSEITPALINALRDRSVDSTGLLEKHLGEKLKQVQGMDLAHTCQLGMVQWKDTAAVNAILASIRSRLPDNLRFAWSTGDDSGASNANGHSPESSLLLLKASQNGKGILDKPKMANVKAEFNKNTQQPEVYFEMERVKDWARVTKANIGRDIAIELDGYVYSWPMVIGEIPDGACVINGNFTMQNVNDLATLLKVEALPCPVNIVQEEEEK